MSRPLVHYALLYVCTFSLTCLTPSLAAQGSRTPGLRMIDRQTLLTANVVRKELSIDEKQGKEIDAIIKKKKDSWDALFSSYRSTKGEKDRKKRTQKREEIIAKRDVLSAEAEKSLVEVLNEKQNLRMNEILLQHRGLYGIVTERVIGQLELNASQVKQIRDAIAGREQKELNAQNPSTEERLRYAKIDGKYVAGTKRELLHMIREEAEKQAMTALSDEQRKQLVELKGKPFPIRPRTLFRRRFLGVDESTTIRKRPPKRAPGSKKAEA